MKEKNRVGRPRTTPKQSKKCKYYYLICVNFHGKDTLKLGISSNVFKRMKQYNNSDTNGYLKEILNVYKCSDPKRLEQVVKYFLPQFIPNVAKMEYYDIEHYEFVKEKTKYLADLFHYSLEEFDFEKVKEEEIAKNERKMNKKLKNSS